ncbi:hypothetical protein VRK_25040 [Vibrio sp. MEBiC08052]|nr:hypothetical protein VRK_25040 [Vibrio sp. MEBiC08052]
MKGWQSIFCQPFLFQPDGDDSLYLPAFYRVDDSSHKSID